MRFLLSLLLLLTFLYAQEEKQKITIGGGAYFQTQPYIGTKTLVVPTPVIFFDNSLFYIRWSRAGVYFLGNKSDDFAWGLSLTAQPRPFGFQPSDSDALKNLDERETTFEGGLAFSAAMDGTYIEIMLLTDLMGRYESWLLKTEIGDKYTLGDFTLYPSIVVSYQSDDFMNYYYGISQDEAIKSKYNYYNPKAGFQVGVQTYISYPLTKELSTLINIRADRVPKSAQDSPIIEQNVIYSGLLSLIYRFEY